MFAFNGLTNVHPASVLFLQLVPTTPNQTLTNGFGGATSVEPYGLVHNLDESLGLSTVVKANLLAPV